MIKATIPFPLQDVYNFIDNRLVLQMAQTKLKQFDPGAPFTFGKKPSAFIQNVDNTVLYLEKGAQRGAFLVKVAEKKGVKGGMGSFGVALRVRPDGNTEMYIDEISSAYRKSILPAQKITGLQKILAIVFGVGLIVGLSIFMLPAFIFAMIVMPIVYPFQYLKLRRDFQRNLKRMEAIVAIFQREFGITSQADSGDWLSFWGRVKSKTPDLLDII